MGGAGSGARPCSCSRPVSQPQQAPTTTEPRAAARRSWVSGSPGVPTSRHRRHVRPRTRWRSQCAGEQVVRRARGFLAIRSPSGRGDDDDKVSGPTEGDVRDLVRRRPHRCRDRLPRQAAHVVSPDELQRGVGGTTRTRWPASAGRAAPRGLVAAMPPLTPRTTRAPVGGSADVPVTEAPIGWSRARGPAQARSPRAHPSLISRDTSTLFLDVPCANKQAYSRRPLAGWCAYAFGLARPRLGRSCRTRLVLRVDLGEQLVNRAGCDSELGGGGSRTRAAFRSEVGVPGKTRHTRSRPGLVKATSRSAARLRHFTTASNSLWARSSTFASPAASR